MLMSFEREIFDEVHCQFLSHLRYAKRLSKN